MRAMTWMLGVGLILVMPLVGGALDDREGKIAQRSVGTRDSKPTTAPVSEDQKGESLSQSGEPQHRKPIRAANLPVYKPPLRGAPGGRVGGGTRGTGGAPHDLALRRQRAALLE
jgi:hypothetical protein